MNEAAMRKYVRDGLHDVGVLTSHHEDMLNVGLPDLSYSGNRCNGWIELKYLKDWPKRPETIVRIDHYTPQQRAWLLRRGQAGGRCYLLLRVREEHLLFGHLVAQYVGQLPRGELYGRALGIWTKGARGQLMNFNQLAERITL